ncbi:class I SAM-dependent methyltransferase [Caulobacter soli]|uniref:class I SAM-dependent methyltransferase n=1 Tax=Caulobacter soli TaxID=2708539 RepID=UPI0013EBD266|nr:methyltransferase domain-containing protein [Caulobacter soli]
MSESIDPRHFQPALPLPGGYSRDQILRSLLSFSIDGGAGGELEGYAREDCDRFLHTLSLVPEGPLRILEIGANPYFLTYLLKLFRPSAEVTLVNYFGAGDSGGVSRQSLRARHPGGEWDDVLSLDFHIVNIEDAELPFADASFDLVLYCEVIEHMTRDPLSTILKLKKTLKPEGRIIVTTPNVARLENVARLIAGANLYDPYSGYGPYGRHNREYTRHELHHLLKYCGFVEEAFFTADVHDNHAGHFSDVSKFADLLRGRAHDLGQYLFTRCVNAGPAPTRLPTWLYRSYAPDRLDDRHGA